MNKYINTIVINGIEYPYFVEASTYADALAIVKQIKRKTKFKFKGRLKLN